MRVRVQAPGGVRCRYRQIKKPPISKNRHFVKFKRRQIFPLYGSSCVTTYRIPFPVSKYSHQHTSGEYPGVSFLGKPVEFTVRPEQKSVTISPPGHGVSMKIPQDAVHPDKPVNVSFKVCLSGSFKYPEGYRPLSSVYHISTDTPFEKDIELSMEHFADIEMEKQAKDMTIFTGRHLGGNEVAFTPMGGGRFEAGKETCTISTRKLSFMSAGAKQTSKIRKLQSCYKV